MYKRQRYMLSGSLRYDGGSVFGANNKWGIFPAVSGGDVYKRQTLNVGTSAEDLLLELDASCEPAVAVYLNVIYAILSLLASPSV